MIQILIQNTILQASASTVAKWAIGLMSVTKRKLQKKKQKLPLAKRKNKKMRKSNLHLTLLPSQSDPNHVCTIDRETFFAITKNIWIENTSSCHITNNDDIMFDVETSNETVHRSSGTIKGTKLGKKKVQLNKWNEKQKISSFSLLNLGQCKS